MTSKIKQKGSILVFSVMILTILLTISITLAKVFIPKIRVATEAANSVSAIFAADTGIEWCLYTFRHDTNYAKPNMANSTINYYSVYKDSDPIELSVAPFCGPEVVPMPSFRSVGTYAGVSRSMEIYKSEN